MPLWKGKRKDPEKLPKVMLCPNCLKPDIHPITGISGIYAPIKYSCHNCGYKGRIYVDISEDKKEKEMLDWLKDEFPEDVIETKSAQELACECLKEKWIPNQTENKNSIREWCPFCADVQVNCAICKCPPELCCDQATGGLIGKLNEMYDDETLLCDVDPGIYKEIVEGFQELCEGNKSKEEKNS